MLEAPEWTIHGVKAHPASLQLLLLDVTVKFSFQMPVHAFLGTFSLEILGVLFSLSL